MRLIRKIGLIFSPSLYLRSIKAIYYVSQELSHSEFLHKLLIEEKVDKFLEVGVNEGVNLFYLAKRNPNIIFYGVDPYYSSEFEIEEIVHGTQKTIYENDKYNQMLLRIRKLKFNNVHLVKKTSLEAAKDYDDEELDFVFIDGDHSYQNVKEDIHLWLPKIKVGGYLAGHDFSLEWFSVVRAVEDTIGLNKIIVNVPAKVWIYRKSV